MTEDDNLILKQEEPQAEFTQTPVAGISIGRQSQVEVLKFPSNGRGNTLVVWKRMGVRKGLTESEANQLHSRLRPYRRSLRNAGWNIPKLFQTRVHENGTEYQVVSFESYIPGGDGEHLVADGSVPNFKKWYILRAALETLAEYNKDLLTSEVVAGRLVTRLPHGMDLKLANLVMSPDNVLYFVDLFGPKELAPGGSWTSYTRKLESIDEESLRAVCATREGAILRLYRLAEKSWIASGSITLYELRDGFTDVLEQSGIPPHERQFIVEEVENEYPWLDKLYTEGAV